MEEWIGQHENEAENQLDTITQYWDNAKEDNNEEEEFQSQLMAKGNYMIDKDDSNNFYHEDVQIITTFGSEEIVDNQ